MYLGAKSGKLCLISDIANDYGISRNHLVKVVHGLARGGFVTTYRGRGGGVTLARDPSEIGIGELVRYTEGPVRPVECFHGAELCVITPACTLPGILREAVENFLKTLDRYTLADLLTHRRRLGRLLFTHDDSGARRHVGSVHSSDKNRSAGRGTRQAT